MSADQTTQTIDLVVDHISSQEEAMEYDFALSVERARELMQHDNTGLTSLMIMESLYRSWTEKRLVPLSVLMSDPQGHAQWATDENTFFASAFDENYRDNRDNFVDIIASAATKFGANSEGVQDFQDHIWKAACLRRDALHSVATLEEAVFCVGETSEEPPQINLGVYEFENVNSLLSSLRGQMTNGVTMCLIRDPNSETKYFVLAIRNGENIVLLADREKMIVPMGDTRMTSRRSVYQFIELKNKAGHRFPYQLLIDLSFEPPEHLPVRTDMGFKIKTISELRADQLVWFLLVFDLIKHKYFSEDMDLSDRNLYYTGEMVVNPEALVSRDSDLVLRGKYKILEVEDLRNEDMTPDFYAEMNTGKSVGFYRWMEERYGHLVEDRFLNLVKDDAKNLGEAITPRIRGYSDVGPAVKTMVSGQEVTIAERVLQSINPDSFGTESQIKSDRLYIARNNKLRVVQAFADKERDEIIGKDFRRLSSKSPGVRWFRKKVLENSTMLAKQCALLGWELPTAPSMAKFTKKIDTALNSEGLWDYNSEGPRENALYVTVENTSSPTFDILLTEEGFSRPIEYGVGMFCSCANTWDIRGDVIRDQYPIEDVSQAEWNENWKIRNTWNGSRSNYASCLIYPGKPAKIWAHLSLKSPHAIAEILDMNLEDLPFWLRYWYGDNPYVGNSLLNRTNPLDSALRNPYKKFSPDFYFGISRQAFKDLRKEMNLPRLKTTRPKKSEVRGLPQIPVSKWKL